MTTSYVVRLALLSSATFFLGQLLLGALIARIAPAAIRRTATMRPQRAARCLLTLRLLPTALSAFLVIVLCVPSYLRFEPGVVQEDAGYACLLAAMLGAAFCAFAVWKAVAALIRSSRYVRECGGRESRVAGEAVWIVRQSAGVALAGILNPRLLISEDALRRLSGDQLRVALRHEHAHRVSRDNLKRLLILLAPSIFPGLKLLEQSWAKCAEWAADDRASQGDAIQSAALAAALVTIARLQAGIAMPSLVTSLVEAGDDLSPRVDRLLEPPVYTDKPRSGAIALAGAALLICSIAINPASLRIVHQLLESLLD